MKECKAPLAAAICAAALIALPAAGASQTPPAQPPQTEQPQATAAPQDPAGAHAQHQQHSATGHLQQAKTVLNDIQTTSVTGVARTKLTQLKRHMASLERSVASPAASTKGARAQRTAPAWAAHLASVDKTLTDLTSESVKVDEATRSKLAEVRTHITAFAAAMSGSATPAASTQTPPEPKTTAKPDTPQEQPAASQTAGTQAGAQSAATVDKEAARRHLTAARDTLSQLTQLPEAAQLAGEARTQVSQLITNFNELITTQADWRASYARVSANLTALLGAERTDEANVAPPATGTAGAVGTAGIASLDPKVREKLVEFRSKLVEFERASGGGGAPAPRAQAPATPDPAPDSTANTRPAATPAPPATTGTAGTSGTTAAQPPPPAQQHQQHQQHQQPAQPGMAAHGHEQHAAAMQHIAAIEAILNPPSTSGAAADVKLDRAQIDQLRMHLTELKKLMQQARKE